jgi:hypothetical protein
MQTTVSAFFENAPEQRAAVARTKETAATF